MTNLFLKRDRSRHPAALTPDYKSTRFRAPEKPLVMLEQSAAELTGPVFGHDLLGEKDNNLIENYAADGGEPIGPRLKIVGRVIDENGKPVPHCLIEIWQANAGGRYRHKAESYRAPLDPNFGGCGRTITATDGSYEFITIRPAAYPFPNGPNSWRPAHIHFSLFGDAFAQRLVTQMYFEGDPLIPLCPIVETLPDQDAIRALTALYDPEATLPMDMQAYRFDIVLRGRSQTLFENRMEGL